jgi:hypothetical protein
MPNSTNALSAPAEEILNQTPPVRPERLADAQLALPAHAADQHHAGDVQAHDQEHGSGEAEEHAEHASGRRAAGGTVRVVGLDGRRFELVRCRMQPRETGHGCRNRGVRAREGCAAVEPAMEMHPVDRPVVSKIRICAQTRVPLQGDEQQGAGRLKEVEVTAKPFRRDAHHDVREAIDRDGFADDFGIGSRPAAPEVVAHHHPRLGRRHVVDRGLESRPAGERHAKRAEVVRRDVQRRHSRRRRVVRGGRADLAGISDPARKGHPGIGLPQGLVIGIRPSLECPHAGFGAEGTHRQHQELDEAVGIDAARRRRDPAGEGGERDDRSHADAERDDAHQRERPIFCERSGNMREIASQRADCLQAALGSRQTAPGCVPNAEGHGAAHV